MVYVNVFQTGQENLCKIGRTRGDVEKRRQDLSTGNPHLFFIFRVIKTGYATPVGNFPEFENPVLANKLKFQLGQSGGNVCIAIWQNKSTLRYHHSFLEEATELFQC
jgi:hypothetical protein